MLIKVPPEEWEVLARESVLEHPFVTVSLEQVRLPDGQVIPDWPKIYARDYVNALIMDASGKAMIMEGYKHGAGRRSWQVLGGYLEEGEDPMTAVQRELLEETGYSSNDWFYLGSYVVDANRHIGVGHFFCAFGAQKIAQPDSDDVESFAIKWVSPGELRQALLDGRIAVISYAITISLALLTLGLNQRLSSSRKVDQQPPEE
jgi:ADP-ribose pyrophosphatase